MATTQPHMLPLSRSHARFARPAIFATADQEAAVWQHLTHVQAVTTALKELTAPQMTQQEDLKVVVLVITVHNPLLTE